MRRGHEHRSPPPPVVHGGVKVTVYVESSAPVIRSTGRSRKGPKKWLRPTTRCTTKRTYDRRAQLLAYSVELRRAAVQEPLANPVVKPKKWKWSLPLNQIQKAMSRVLRKKGGEWRYESIETEGAHKSYSVCNPRRMSCKNVKQRWISRVLKKLSRGWGRWRCNKW